MLVLILLLGSNNLMLPSTQIFTLLRLNKSSLPWQYGQLLSSAAIAASILVVQRGNRLEQDRSHDPLDPELGNTGTFRNSHRAGSVSGEAPHIVIAAVFVLDDSLAVSHDDAVVPECRRPRQDMPLVPVRKFHRNVERKNAELAFLKVVRLRRCQVDPGAVAFRRERVLTILDLDYLLSLLHAAPFPLPSRMSRRGRIQSFSWTPLPQDVCSRDPTQSTRIEGILPHHNNA